MGKDTLLFVLGQKDPLNLHRLCFFYVGLVNVDGTLISFNTSLVGCLSFTLYINFCLFGWGDFLMLSKGVQSCFGYLVRKSLFV